MRTCVCFFGSFFESIVRAGLFCVLSLGATGGGVMACMRGGDIGTWWGMCGVCVGEGVLVVSDVLFWGW